MTTNRTATATKAPAKATGTARKAPAKAPAKPAAKPNAAPVAAPPAAKAPVVRKTGVVKANAFAELAKAHGYKAETTGATETGATVTVTRGRESMTFVWAANKLVIKPLPEWQWKSEDGKSVVKTLVVHNVGEAKRIFLVPADEAGPEKAAAVRMDSTLTGTNRTPVAAETK